MLQLLDSELRDTTMARAVPPLVDLRLREIYMLEMRT
jgi:hypothetical protein